MAGGPPDHAAIAVNVSSSLHGQLRGSTCRVFSSDLRIRVLETGLGTYPDVAVVCGDLEYAPDSGRTTVTNPTVLIEVLSDSTEEHDRGFKMDHYRRIGSVREIVLVSHREKHVEVFRRSGDGTWNRFEAGSGGLVQLESIGCTLQVEEVYAGTNSLS
jgi:Uma2 family endonuclease